MSFTLTLSQSPWIWCAYACLEGDGKPWPSLAWRADTGLTSCSADFVIFLSPLMIEFKYLFIYLRAIWISFLGVLSLYLFPFQSIAFLKFDLQALLKLYIKCVMGLKIPPHSMQLFPSVFPCLELGLVLWLALTSGLWKEVILFEFWARPQENFSLIPCCLERVM